MVLVIADHRPGHRSPGRFCEALGSASAGRAAANASASQLQALGTRYMQHGDFDLVRSQNKGPQKTVGLVL